MLVQYIQGGRQQFKRTVAMVIVERTVRIVASRQHFYPRAEWHRRQNRERSPNALLT